MTNLFSIVVIGIGTASILIIAFSWLFARLWCMPRRRIPAIMPAYYGLPYESITFRSKGSLVNGWFIPPPDNYLQVFTIIVPHGWSGNTSDLLPLAKLLHHAGYAVLLYNTRGHGNSDYAGPITILKFAEDIISSIDYIWARNNMDSKPLGVIGHSIGASAAIVAASMDARLQVLVNSSAFADPVQLTRDTMKRLHIPRGLVFRLVVYFIERWLGVPMDSIAPKNVIAKVNSELLLIHGDRDKFVDPDNLDTLFSHAVQEKTQHKLIEGADHTNIINFLSYDDNFLVRFLDEKFRFREVLLCPDVKDAGSGNIPKRNPIQ